MLRHERRLLRYCLYVGIALTLLVIAADSAGMLTPLENYLYDTRALLCQHFTPPPTDRLVHLDIDDAAIDTIGRFPWSRDKVAQIIEEIGVAQPKVIELDVLLGEAQDVEYRPVATTAPSTTQPVECIPFDNDAQLAAEMRKLGNLIVPATFQAVGVKSPEYLALVDALTHDLEIEQGELANRFEADTKKLALTDRYFVARREAIVRRLSRIDAGPAVPFATIRAQLLPKTPSDVNSGVVHVLGEELEKFRSAASFRRFSLPAPSAIRTENRMQLQITPLHILSDAALSGAFVNYIQFGSPVIRSIPLLLEDNGRFYPQMGLAIACRMLDADMSHMRVENNRLIIPVPSKKDLVLPMTPPRVSADGVLIGNLMDIPWVGGRDWIKMYNRSSKEANGNHIAMNDVWQACTARQKVIHNNAQLDAAIMNIYLATQDNTRAIAYDQQRREPEDFESRAKVAQQLINDWKPFVPDYQKMKPEEMRPDDVKFLAGYNAAVQMTTLTPQLVKELAEFRSDLSATIKGKAVLVGWIATSAIADFVPTSLHEKCPGVVVHGVVFNGIMTGELWAQAPEWLADVIAFALAMITSFSVGFFSPVRAFLISLGVAALYALVNGFLLFDYGNYIVGLAAPLLGIGMVWGGCTLTRVMVEQRERARITRRFGNYADSKLVDHVMENEELSFEGENREVTVVFTDFANFTSLSERLGEKIVLVLNELLGELVPVIRDTHQGYVNKFMGDGIMFFYNAPKHVRDHAADAVATVLDMQVKLTEFNIRLRDRGLPELAMRGGIASGTVVVGDAGGGGRSDYTCLGDAVNLSSRLEGANKVTGTHTLINDRAAELLNGQFLVRPIGKIQAVGKKEAVMCYEPLAKADAATDGQRQLVAVTGRLVDAFVAARFDECLTIAGEMETLFGPAKLPALYRSMCERYLHEPPGADFDGRIVLTEK